MAVHKTVRFTVQTKPSSAKRFRSDIPTSFFQLFSLSFLHLCQRFWMMEGVQLEMKPGLLLVNSFQSTLRVSHIASCFFSPDVGHHIKTHTVLSAGLTSKTMNTKSAPETAGWLGVNRTQPWEARLQIAQPIQNEIKQLMYLSWSTSFNLTSFYSHKQTCIYTNPV